MNHTTHPRKGYVNAVAVTITADDSAFQRRMTEAAAAIRRAGEGAAKALTEFRRTARRWAESFAKAAHALHNDPVHVAGLEGRYLIRGGLDPAYRDEHDLVVLVTKILDGTEDDARYLDHDNRVLVATAVLRGWATSYPAEAPEVLAWHRAFGGTHVSVGRSAA